jgi:hypothetical protein
LSAGLPDWSGARISGEIAAGTRWLDLTGNVTREEAVKRLLDHQIAELGMLLPHIDGVGRAMTMMRLEAEDPVPNCPR